MKKYFAILLLVLFSFCSKKRESTLPQLLVEEVDNVISVNSKEMLQSQPPLLALNFKKDTIIAKDYYDYLRNDKNLIDSHSDSLKSKNELKIYIDDSYSFYNKGFVFKNLDWPTIIDSALMMKCRRGEIDIKDLHPYFKQKDSLENLYVNSYPILIYNNSKEVIRLYKPKDSGYLMMIQEALDTDKKWKPIEFFFNYSRCGTGSTDYLIYPKKYFATSIIKYKGTFKTKIRVKLFSGRNILYSNVIEGYINRSQFNQDFTKKFLKDRGFFYDLSEYNGEMEFMFLNQKMPK